MENLPAIEDLMLNGGDGVGVFSTLFAFAVCLAMAFILRQFYVQRSYSLSGKSHIASILPILSAVVFIVIVVVKSSLALSLGLVGALSIVRFRTPIKEPEELVYLFLAIAIGLGYGAGHVLITTVLVTITLFVVYLWLSNRGEGAGVEYNFVVRWKRDDLDFDTLLQRLKASAQSIRLVRLDRGAGNNVAVFLVTAGEGLDFDGIAGGLRELDGAATLSFYEADTNL